MRRWALALLVVAVANAHASQGSFIKETLVGWSADGKLYAVVRFIDGENWLHVRDAELRSVGTWKDGDKGVPEAGVERIDVTKWKPAAKHGLRRVDAAARKRFAQAYELVATGRLQKGEQHRCTGGSYSLVRKADRKTVFEHAPKNDYCFAVHGGYLHADGKHVLVKVSETWAKDTPDGHQFGTETTFRLIVVD